MKQIFKLSHLLLAVLLPANAIAYNFEVDGIYYDIYGDEVTVTAKEFDDVLGDYISDYTGNVSIPTDVNWNGHNYSVTKIGDCAFYNCTGLTSINIPNSVISIGSAAFRGCTNLSCINVPTSVTKIGDGAFYNCTGLTSINIPNSVVSVASNAFYGTMWYNNQPNGLIYVGSVAYKYKGTMPEGTSISIREGTAEIASSAFSGCSGLTNITIPNSVISIGDCAFCNCTGLTSINIPNSVASIGDRAFYGTVWYDNQPDGLVYTGLVAYKYKGTMPEGTDISLRDGTLAISGRAFSGCSGLASIIIPNTVRNIGSEAFFNCIALTNVNIPNSVTSIGESAFCECSGLTSIDIPNSISTIARYTFNGCGGLCRVNIPNSVKIIEEGAFIYCNGLTIANLPDSLLYIGRSAFYGCNGLINLIIPSSVTIINDNAFKFCNGLTNISVESGNYIYDSRNNCNAIIETASNNLIKGCVKSIIPNTVTSIGNYAFEGCDGLTNIEIPNSVTTIRRHAFYDCDGITSLNIPNSVTFIGEEAFCACDYLTSVSLPNSLTSIGQSAFSWCDRLNDVYCYVNDPSNITLGSNAFYLYNSWHYALRTLHVPAGSKSLYLASNGYNYFGYFVEMETPPDPIIKGDVNGDGEVNIADINAIIDMILSGSTNVSGDVNNDAEVNIADVNAVIDIILTGKN